MSSEESPGPVCGPCRTMEVVEAAEQLETLQFGSSSQGPAASEERGDAKQAERGLPAGEQPPAPSADADADAGGSPPQPDRPPPSEACVTGPDAAEPPPALQASDSSDSDSDSDRWSARAPWGCRAGPGGGGLGRGWRLSRAARAGRRRRCSVRTCARSRSRFPGLAAWLSHGVPSLERVPTSFPNSMLPRVTSRVRNLCPVLETRHS